MFARLGRWCFRNRGKVVVLWLVALAAASGASRVAGEGFSTEFGLPEGIESARGLEILDEHFENDSLASVGSIVFYAEQGIADPDVTAAITEMLDAVGEIDGLTVTSPFSPEGAQQIAMSGPQAGKIAFAGLGLEQNTSLEEASEITAQIRALIPEVEGLQVEIGGQAFAEFDVPSSEALGLAFAIVVLILAFGSVLAMGLPIGVALAGIGIGSLLTALLSNVLSIPDFAPTVAVMLGLGVGIDYALFIVTRFRENLAAGHDFEESTVIALDTAGRAVAFAGTTVVISLLGMLLMNLAFVSGIAVSAAVAVAVTAIASLTLLPALLGFANSRVEVTRWRGLIAAAFVAAALAGFALEWQWLLVGGVVAAAAVILLGFALAPLRQEVPRRKPKLLQDTIPYRWSRFIQRHPWSMALLGAVILLVLAAPMLSLRLGFSDEGNYPPDTTTRRAYDLLAEGFGPGFNGPLLLAGELDGAVTPEALMGITAALQADPGVAFATPPIPNDQGAPTAIVWQVIPTTAPQDEETTDLVHRLRDEVLPAATEGVDLDVLVSGQVALGVDFSEYLTDRLPIFMAMVLGLSFLLLLMVFRSVLVPLKAVIMNLLAIGAAYGVVTAVFQWGWLGNILGVEPAPVEPFVPMMMFAVVFGLSMDYEVFLLSRIREEWLRGGDSRRSVADGLAATARVISAAAAIMVVVFGSFVLEPDRIIKLFGVGLATAVALDATVVRLLLVPATMELLGDKNWWLPRWLDRILPRIDVEGHSLDALDTGEQTVSV
ncbi:MAG TPA: MMPL family transporter [Acidimicrobiia bacterium]